MLKAFEATAAVYGHGKQKGQVLTAAMLMFLEADPRDQGAAVSAVLEVQTRRGVSAMLTKARKRQHARVLTRDADGAAHVTDTNDLRQPLDSEHPLKISPPPATPRATRSTRPARAAKKRGSPRKPIKTLPRLEDRD